MLWWTISCFQAFLEGERAMTFLTKETRNELLLGAATNITGSYYELAAELVSVVSIQIKVCLTWWEFLLFSIYLIMWLLLHAQARKTESSLQRIRQGAQRRAGASSDVSDHSISDTDKICMQLFLDIQVVSLSLSLSLNAQWVSKLTCIIISTGVWTQPLCYGRWGSQHSSISFLVAMRRSSG